MLKEQNKIIQDELDGYNISLENFEQIQNDLNEAIAKLNNLKK
jgi:prefoldin subunit 5